MQNRCAPEPPCDLLIMGNIGGTSPSADRWGYFLRYLRTGFPVRRRTGLAAGVLLLAFTALTPLAHAETADRQTKLQALAAQFSQRVGGALQDADIALSPDMAKNEARKKEFDALLDGEVLLLQTTLREAKLPHRTAYKVQDPIMAMKQGHDAYISLVDFIFVAGYAIKIDPEAGTATGWYLNEDTPFVLDTKNHTITRGDVTENYPPEAIISENEDFYIQSALMEKWFDMTVDVMPRFQVMEMVTNNPLPVQDRVNRQKRRNGTFTRNRPEKERLPEEFRVATLPRADVTLTSQVESRGDGSEADNYNRYSILSSNQLLNHEMTGYFSGAITSSRDAEPLEQIRLNFKRESENNDLLGPLAAKVYEFNDITTTNVPYTGGSPTERGFRVSNQSQRYSIDTETIIDGDAQPGWDVELYRNNSYVGGVSVDETGRYTFERVQLFAGDNRFRVVFFGPEGQQREEERIVTVLPNLVGDIKGYYNASLSQKDTITYEANPTEDQDSGTMRFAGVYDRRVTDNLTLRGGLHTRETLGQRDNYFYSGAVTSLGDAIVNADLVTTSDGPYKALLTGRKRFDKTNVTAGLEHVSPDFSDSFIDEDTSISGKDSVYGVVTGPFMPSTFSYVTYDADSRVTFIDTGETTTKSEFGLNSRFMGMNFDNSLALSTSTGGNDTDRDRVLTYYGGAMGRKNGYMWRGRLEYEIMPLAEPTAFNASVNKAFNAKISGFGDVRHQFQNELSTATVGMSYYGDKARISPQLSVDSESNVQAKVNVNFSVGKDPYSNSYTLSGAPISNQGGLSVFAYLDKAGNGVFDEGDEPLPDVVINAVQHNVKLSTNDEGIAYSSNLPTNRPTDVTMEENSAFDPTWVPGYEGASIRVRPSEVIRMEFPVVRGAEIDGTASIARVDGEPSPARSMDIKMITPDGIVAKVAPTGADGFYIIEAVRPGVYFFVTDSRQSATTAYRAPEKMVITPDGAQIYGKNIMLTRGYDIPFTFSASNTNPALSRRTKILKPEDIAREDVYIRLGNYRSSLAASLAWYKLKLQTRSWNNPLTPMASDFDSVVRDERTGRLPLLLKPAQPLRIEEAALLCERLVDAGFGECGVDVVTTYHDGSNAAAASEALTKG